MKTSPEVLQHKDPRQDESLVDSNLAICYIQFGLNLCKKEASLDSLHTCTV